MKNLQVTIKEGLFYFSMFILLIGCQKQKISTELQYQWGIEKSNFESLNPFLSYSEDGTIISSRKKALYFRRGSLGVSKDRSSNTFFLANYKVQKGQIEIFDSNELKIDGVYTPTISIVKESNLMKEIKLELRNDSNFILLKRNVIKADLFK